MDAKRGKLFSRLIKEVTVAARVGGANPDSNSRLRLALEKSREHNVPSDNIDRAVKRGNGKLEGAEFEEIRYEGFGPGGAAVIADCLTDNKNRTVAEVRRAFTKHGGNLGAAGSVVHLFRHCGQIFFAPGADADSLMEVAVAAGAEDFFADDSDGSVEIITRPADLAAVKESLQAAGFKPDHAEVVMRPTAEMTLSDSDAKKMRALAEALEQLDDVQQIYTSAELD